VPNREVFASDGLRARDNGAWGRVKLAFLDDFGPVALLATAKMKERYYLDLFAGPGVNIERGGAGAEFEGSPLRALRMTAEGRPDLHFTHAFFVNADRRDHEALVARVDRLVASGESRVARERIKVVNDDSNFVLPRILQAVPTFAYLFVFADIEAPKQWPWRSVQQLRRYGHASVDYYTLFPLDMAINRLISYRETQTERHAETLTRFFGTEAWRDIAARRLTDAQSPELRRALEDLYVAQLKSEGPPRMWRYAGPVKEVRRTGRHSLYKMLFASNHSAGDRIAQWARRQTGAQQLGLF
jgi:three-Cys-motif partner protein